MMRRFLFLAVILSTVLGISLLLIKSTNEQVFTQIPVSFFPFVSKPLIKVEIEGKKYSLLIDLGSSHPIDLKKKIIDRIEKKDFAEISNYIGFKGTVYPVRGYRLPEVRILNASIEGLIAFEENLEFLKDSKTWISSGIWDWIYDQLSFFRIDGRIGWSAFRDVCCFFDFPNTRICFAKEMATLSKEAKFSSDDFVKIPFQIENCGVVIAVQFDEGIKKVLLDTGATRSIIKEDSKKCDFVNKQIIIDGHDFGIWKFKQLHFSKVFKVDGFLGVDFFKKHSICLDFSNKIAYIKQEEMSNGLLNSRL